MNGSELLPSWSEGAAKSAILEFVESVSRPGASDASCVPPAEALANAKERGWTIVSMRGDFKAVLGP